MQQSAGAQQVSILLLDYQDPSSNHSENPTSNPSSHPSELQPNPKTQPSVNPQWHVITMVHHRLGCVVVVRKY